MTTRIELPLISGTGAAADSCCSSATAPTTPVDAPVVAEFTVSGMTCSHCAAAVSDEVRALNFVVDAAVDLDSGRLVVGSSAPVPADAIRAAVTEAGYAITH